MPTKEYEWQSISNPPIIKPHSIAKHEVIAEYLRAYIRKLTLDPRHPTLRLHIIDGFSGGGIYKRHDNQEIHWGSPIIIHNILKEEEARINTERKNKFSLQFKLYLTEKSPSSCELLKLVLNENNIPFDNDGKNNTGVTFLEGNFTSHFHKILNKITNTGKTERVIFILDQYGYSEVPMDLIYTIFKKLPKAEVLLTFATDWIIDYLSTKEEFVKRIKNTFEKLGLISSNINFDPKEIKESPQWRRIAQSYLSESIRENTGAVYYTPFFIKSTDSHRSYWLIHLSQHVIARDEMLKIHWQQHNHFTHPGGAGLNMLGYVPELDESQNQNLSFDFAFDDQAKNLSLSKLENEIPRYIYDLDGSITLEQLLDKKVNSTPADMEMIKEILGRMISYGDLSIESQKGTNRRKGSAIILTDIITPNRKFWVLPASSID
jgi:three-Cys-motif partner protein